jgi:hypothetical protein
MLSLVAALAAFQAPAGEPPAMRPGRDGRGRDPWVFRAIFEDRTRMVILAPAPNWWMAFNPETGAMHKVWRGKMDFRGKVWDFSQDNSRASGRLFMEAPSEIWRLPDQAPLPPEWEASGVVFEKGSWTFTRPGASLKRRMTDAGDWHRVFLAFDETGRKGRFLVSIKDEPFGIHKDDKPVAPQWFESATSVTGENDWQWNFKRIERPSHSMTIEITSPAVKKLRGLRLYGDLPTWFDGQRRPLEVLWDGYELVKQTKAVNLHFRLKLRSGKIVSVTQTPEMTPTGWKEEWTLRGVPKGERIELVRQSLSNAIRVSSEQNITLEPFAAILNFEKSGTYRVRFDVPEGER